MVGDSHVVLRPPTWFRQLKKTPPLRFKVNRNRKQLEYEFSTLFDGVYALKFPAEDAHGTLDISVWTTKSPRLNQTFQVEFGTPWLKVSGWQKAAEAMTEQIREDLVAAQSGLFKAYGYANKRVQYFFKDAVVRADTLLKEAEKFGLSSLTSTLQSTEQMVNHSKELSSSLTQRIRKSSGSTSDYLLVQRKVLGKEISSYSRKMSSVLAQHATALTEAASGLNLGALGQEIQAYRETHFREAQIKLLQTWWGVSGIPEGVQNNHGGARSRKQPVKAHKKQRPSHRRYNPDAWLDDEDAF